MRKTPPKGHIGLMIDGRQTSVAVGKIRRVEGMNNYVMYYLHDGRKHLMSYTMKRVAGWLGTGFIRINQSVMVAKSEIAAAVEIDYRCIEVELRSGEVLRVGKTRIKELRHELGPWLAAPYKADRR